MFVALFSNSAKSNCVDSLYTRFDSISIVFTSAEKISELNRIRNLCPMQSEGYFQRMGFIYQDAGNNDIALIFFDSALIFAPKNKRPGPYASIMTNIGNVYFNIGNYRKALEYYTTDIEAQLEDSKYFESLIGLTYNKATVFLSLGNLDSAIIFANKTFDFVNKTGTKKELEYYSCLRGDIYRAQKMYLLSISEYEKSVKQSLIVDDFYVAGSSASNSAISYQELGIYDSAMAKVNESIYYILKSNDKNAIKDVYKTAYELSKNWGNDSMSIELLKKYVIFKDSTLTEASIKSIAESELKIKDLINFKDLEIAKADLRTSKTRFLLASIAVGLLILIVLIIFRSRQMSKKIATQEISLKDNVIIDLIQKQELSTVNSMLKGQDNERQRIAQDLHDRLGSILALVKLNFSSLTGELEQIKERSEKQYFKTHELIDEAVEEVHRISHDLSIGAVSKFGLKTALLHLGLAVESANKIKVKLILDDMPNHLIDEIQINIYRIFQELIGNTLKYAKAKEVNIQILNDSDRVLNITYEDDGIGFNIEILQNTKGMGFQNVESRVKKLNGSLHMDTKPGNGLSLFIEIPIPQEKLG